MRLRGVQRRLWLILGLTILSLLAAGGSALMALLQTHTELSEVSEHTLPASEAALQLARLGERLRDRTPALLAAADPQERARQSALIEQDLQLLAAEIRRLQALRPRDQSLVDSISARAAELAMQLRDLSRLLSRQTTLNEQLRRQQSELIALHERAQQILGPSLLAIAAVVRDDSTVDDMLFRHAALAQTPLQAAERLIGSLQNDLLLTVVAPNEEQIAQAEGRFQRTWQQLDMLLPAIPVGLYAELRAVTDALHQQSEQNGVFAARRSSLQLSQLAERRVVDSRQTANALKSAVDAIVSSANRAITQAASGMSTRLLANTMLFVIVTAAVVLSAIWLSNRLVVRDISSNLQAVTGAMQRLAAGEREAQVPAMERNDEIGDLARVFNVFKDQALSVETLNRQLLEKSNLLVATFDGMSDGFTVFDGDARLLSWNPQFRQLYRFDDQDIGIGIALRDIHYLLEQRGARFFSTLGEPLPLAVLSAMRHALNQHFEVHCADGQIIELRSNPIPDGGFVTIHIDVTERRAIEGQLRQAQKMEAVGQLTGGIAHDFNNILGAILGNLGFLENALRDNESMYERWRRAMGATERAARQVERLLAFSRRQRLEAQNIDINELVVGMIDLLEYSLGAAVVVETAFGEDLPMVCVDPGQLENALMNLAINARDAMDGRGEIRFTTRRVGQASVEVAISDTGHGIPPELIDRVIEPFFTTKDVGKGSGLGLSMVYGFARQSGGNMLIESRPAEGTTVRIRLPIATAEADRPTVTDSATDLVTSPASGDPSGALILVVDDDRDMLAVSAQRLRDLGYRVIEAVDGETALAALRRESGITLLFTDITMPPPWDGISLAREARMRCPHLAVVYTSAADHEIAQSAILLRKPASLEQLAAAIRRGLENREIAEAKSPLLQGDRSAS